MLAAADDQGAELLRIAQMAAGSFVKTHPGLQYAYADFLDDAVLGACAAAARYDGGQAALATYAYKRAAGAILDGIRDRALVSRAEHSRGLRLADLPAHRQVPSSWDLLAEIAAVHPTDPADGPATVFERTEEHRQLHAAVAALPEQCRVIIVRNVLGGETLTVIADDLGLSLGRVSQARRRALALLRSALSQAWYGQSSTPQGGVRARNEERAYMDRLTEARIA